MKPRVFVPQMPSRYDTDLRMWVPTVNLAPASKHGDVIVMLPPQANRLHTAPLIQIIKDRMEDCNEQDFIVAVGDPSLIAAAACIATRRTGGLLRMLKWDRQTSDYLITEIKL
jgi:hypothetical protein